MRRYQMPSDHPNKSNTAEDSHRLKAYPVLRVLRLHQWVKNALVFAPLVLGGRSGDTRAWLDALIGFVAFGLTASATYIINDIWDRDHDRTDWVKRTRPVASGSLSIRSGLIVAACTLSLGLAIGYLLGSAAFAILMTYLVVTLAYTLWLKTQPVVDVLIIAGLFTLRLGFGTALAGVRWSPWLFVLSMCTFLSLALAKRFAEVSRGATKNCPVPGRGYLAGDIPFIRGLGLASATAAVLIMIISMIEEAFPANVYDHPYLLWAVPSLLFLFFSRIWLAAERGLLSGDPVTFALTDRTCLVYAGLLGVLVVVALS